MTSLHTKRVLVSASVIVVVLFFVFVDVVVVVVVVVVVLVLVPCVLLPHTIRTHLPMAELPAQLQQKKLSRNSQQQITSPNLKKYKNARFAERIR